jgi:hypothetical protein
MCFNLYGISRTVTTSRVARFKKLKKEFSHKLFEERTNSQKGERVSM